MNSDTSQKSSFNWKKELKETFLIALIGVPWGLITCPDCQNYLYPILVSSTVWVVLWKGNQLTTCWMDSVVGWLEAPVKRLLLGIFGHATFTGLAIFVIYYFYLLVLDIHLGNIKMTMLIAIGVTFIVSLILYSRDFLISWKQLAIEGEKIKKEAILAKYETLKNQVNPHFLFNSFNVLTDLVYEDQDTAARFIKKLSEVYRYVLEARDKEIVTLQSEMKFVESYLFLQQIRHGDSLKFSSDIEVSNASVVPMAIQMLVENSIKHNIVSEARPLEIKIYTENGYLYVSNNLQKKNTIRKEGEGIGLENIKSRYSFLEKRPVIIDEADNTFKVGLPIINSNANTNH
ncbi:hypothetical protein E1176_19925 [Fulvivirga sp. RKSG066]|uniref:sensor histidine kinase n=1 Tax=Fulvivirga aurantia TaxID=2529383 RepID=UPI0012BCA065|nr:histidine kinase [Fulvivirga aurantia]MTI23308.1 hypothetical protein [Fulvivirga aurantia]